jgi:multidrug efflux pump
LPLLGQPAIHWDSLLALLGHGALIAVLWIFGGFDTACFVVLLPMTVASALGSYLFFAQHIGTFGALLGIYLTGGTLNMYSEIGLIILVGISTKNGILIVEFANQLRDRGMAFDDALRQAADIRLRPPGAHDYTGHDHGFHPADARHRGWLREP